MSEDEIKKEDSCLMDRNLFILHYSIFINLPQPVSAPARVRTGCCAVRHRSRLCASSSWCVPCSTMSPSRITRIRSALRMVDRRWAITKLVRFSSGYPWRAGSGSRCGYRPSWWLRPESESSGRPEGAGDGQQLHLSLGDVGGLFVEHHVVAVRQSVDEVIHMRHLRRGNHFFIAWRRGVRSEYFP